jgi:hypothetical protein
MNYLFDGNRYQDLRIVCQVGKDNTLHGLAMEGKWEQIKTPRWSLSQITVLEEYLKQDKSILSFENIPRNTQFLGYAQALFDSLDQSEINIDMEVDGWENRWILRIAQRSYDLVTHVCDAVDDKQTDMGVRVTPECMLDSVPDMPVLPEVKDE